jgi:hypothetical protein
LTPVKSLPQRLVYLVNVKSTTTTPKLVNRRLARERKTVTAMLHIYCRERHGGSFCGECGELMSYVNLRLDRCHFGAEKPTCAKCPVHCYQRDRREQIKAVMRFAGPRMLWEHPWLSLHHFLDGWFRPVAALPALRKSAEPH